MPAPSPEIGPTAQKALRRLGERLRARRKELKLSAVVTAEASGMSRVTLHRIERGEPSVAMGAYLSVVDALGLVLELRDPTEKGDSPPPLTVRPADYPQLKKLAWQLDPEVELSAAEALSLYERNWRHVDQAKLTAREQKLIKRLLASVGRKGLLV